MTRQTVPSSPPPRLCPLCGARATPAARRCLVCGTDLTRPAARVLKPRPRLYPSPFILGLLSLFIVVGVGLLLLATGTVPMPAVLQFPTPTITPTDTPRPTPTSTPTSTNTPRPTATPLPPIEYVVKEGDSCLLIAILHDVTVENIIFLNNLDPNCTIAVGRRLLIPQPTPTPTPWPTDTPKPGEPTRPPTSPQPQATHVVQSGETCLGIALQYYTTVEALLLLNNLGGCDFLVEGQVLLVPLPGAPPTATP